jgi:NitT/TauT family transport system substrate-binding protein
MPIIMCENFRAVFSTPFYAVFALDLYRQQGLDVQFMTSTIPGTAAAGLLDGSVDATWGGPMRVMKARDEPGGPPLVCFREVVCMDPFYLVSPGDHVQVGRSAAAEIRFGLRGANPMALSAT